MAHVRAPNAAEDGAADLERRMSEIEALMGKLKADDDVALIPAVYDAFGREETVHEIQRAIERGCELANAIVLSGADASDARRARANHMLQTLFYVQQAYSAAMKSTRMLRSGVQSGGTDDDLAAGIARFSRVDPEEANAMQQVLLYLLNTAQTRGYRRKDGDCYRPRFTPGGHDTHSWERVCSIRDFVYDATRKELNFYMWLSLTAVRANVGGVVDHLQHCQDVQLPDLKKDRHVFAFRDGIYLAKTDAFVPYPAASVPSDVVAAKYFDADLGGVVEGAEGKDWYSGIPTPHLQSILDYQGMGEDVSRWMYVLIGRLIYDVNEMDGWQVVPYLKGAASSGKSTILTRVCKTLYEPEDVGMLSNNSEKKFGLSAFYDKFIFIGPEIKNDVSLEQAEFQSIVSGETVQVAIKFRTAQTIEWTSPGILAGNEVPGWVDNSGSVRRRIVLFTFPKRVDNGDMELGKKLEGEMPAILLKVNRAYREAVHKYARDNIWKHLPQPFHESKQELAVDTNSINRFLASGELEFGEGLYMPYDEFTRKYRQYVDDLGIKKQAIHADSLRDMLCTHNAWLETKMSTKKWPRDGSHVRVDKFILGADLQAYTHYASRGGDDLLGDV